jgi:uncharacterized protein (TIGR01777 family)
MKILIAGSSGLIGKHLTAHLTGKGHQVYRLVRKSANLNQNEIFWDPNRGILDSQKISGMDAIINLAGDNIAKGRWTKAKKNLLWSSRIDSTKLLVQAIGEAALKPKVFACASAVGFYGDRGDEQVSESSPPGHGFLSKLCVAWEDAVNLAKNYDVRVVNFRFGMVLSASGGALSAMLPIFKLGLGGRLGSGNQYISWLHIDDTVEAIGLCIFNPNISGPINLVSPKAVSNREFALTLSTVLNRSAFLPVPRSLLRFFLGEMAEELLLFGQKVKPNKLNEFGFIFKYKELSQALKNLV